MPLPVEPSNFVLRFGIALRGGFEQSGHGLCAIRIYPLTLSIQLSQAHLVFHCSLFCTRLYGQHLPVLPKSFRHNEKKDKRR